MIGAVLSGIGSLASIATGIANSQLANNAADKNYELQRRTLMWQRDDADQNRAMAERDFEYNKQLQERIFQREDTAVQRMVADNRAAGLSPIAGLAGAGTGQALEANTPQINQNYDTPQMSAHQLNVDFSSLSQLGNTIQRDEQFKDNLKLNQQRLDMEKSSNDENLKLMRERIEQNKLANEFQRATLESRIAGVGLDNDKRRKEIAKISVDTVARQLGNEGQSILNKKNEAELKEWVENAGFRNQLSQDILDNNKFSLEEKKARLALAYLVSDDNHNKNLMELQLISQELKDAKDSADTKYSFKHALEKYGVSSETAGSWQHLFDVVEGLLPSNWNFMGK